MFSAPTPRELWLLRLVIELRPSALLPSFENRWGYHFGGLAQVGQAGPRRLQLSSMPLTVFDVKGISAARRERIETAVEFGGKHVTAPHEAWIATDQQGRVRVIITGPHGFQ